MQFDKAQIINYLNNRGDGEKAIQAESELPAVVDTDDDAELLARLDVQPEDLTGGHPPGPAGMGTPEEGLGI